MSKALTLSLRFGLLLLAVPMPGIAAGVIGVVDTGENTVRVTLASGLEAEVGGRVYDRKGLFSEKKNPETIRWVSAIEKATTIQELIAVIPVMKLRQIAFRGVKFQFSHSVAILGNNIHIFAIGPDKRSTNLGMWKSHESDVSTQIGVKFMEQFTRFDLPLTLDLTPNRAELLHRLDGMGYVLAQMVIDDGLNSMAFGQQVQALMLYVKSVKADLQKPDHNPFGKKERALAAESRAQVELEKVFQDIDDLIAQGRVKKGTASAFRILRTGAEPDVSWIMTTNERDALILRQLNAEFFHPTLVKMQNELGDKMIALIGFGNPETDVRIAATTGTGIRRFPVNFTVVIEDKPELKMAFWVEYQVTRETAHLPIQIEVPKWIAHFRQALGVALNSLDPCSVYAGPSSPQFAD